MIYFHSETSFQLKNKNSYKKWLKEIVKNESRRVGELNYIFCDNAYLLDINVQYLQHDTYTDIITFDYSEDNMIAGDIFISVEMVTENAKEFAVSFEEELLRVLSHGVYHLCGYKDKTEIEAQEMRKKEEEAIKLSKDMNLL